MSLKMQPNVNDISYQITRVKFTPLNINQMRSNECEFHSIPNYIQD